MGYTIYRYVRELLEGTETVQGEPLAAVRARAREAVRLGLAERIEIIDEHNVVCFRWPRTLHVTAA